MARGKGTAAPAPILALEPYTPYARKALEAAVTRAGAFAQAQAEAEREQAHRAELHAIEQVALIYQRLGEMNLQTLAKAIGDGPVMQRVGKLERARAGVGADVIAEGAALLMPKYRDGPYDGLVLALACGHCKHASYEYLVNPDPEPAPSPAGALRSSVPPLADIGEALLAHEALTFGPSPTTTCGYCYDEYERTALHQAPELAPTPPIRGGMIELEPGQWVDGDAVISVYALGEEVNADGKYPAALTSGAGRQLSTYPVDVLIRAVADARAQRR